MKEARLRSNCQRICPTRDRRADSRVPIDVRLMYSGQEEGEELIMGDGSVVDLSNKGLRIRGNVAVKPGIEMTLFVYLPDGRDPLFVLSARVAWAKGHQFGAEILKMNVRERNRLRYFLCSHLQQ
ncbi:MAG TPA: PilZ domain-containing protein [Nitrospira sp.]|nr:PilZ domain-containing protein [Nitrospira sp.]